MTDVYIAALFGTMRAMLAMRAMRAMVAMGTMGMMVGCDGRGEGFFFRGIEKNATFVRESSAWMDAARKQRIRRKIWDQQNG
jgi:hypothetical protein